MRLEFDDGTLLLCDSPETVPYAEWDSRVDEFRAQANRYRSLLEWAGVRQDGTEQATLHQGFDHNLEDNAWDYPDVSLRQRVWRRVRPAHRGRGPPLRGVDVK